MFQQLLEQAVGQVDGAVGCSLFGFDGIPVASAFAEGGTLDAATLGTEISGPLGALVRGLNGQGVGPLAEMSFQGGRLWGVARLLSEDYFLVLFLAPGGNLGKARYVLRSVAPRVRREL